MVRLYVYGSYIKMASAIFAATYLPRLSPYEVAPKKINFSVRPLTSLVHMPRFTFITIGESVTGGIFCNNARDALPLTVKRDPGEMGRNKQSSGMIHTGFGHRRDRGGRHQALDRPPRRPTGGNETWKKGRLQPPWIFN